MYEIGRLCVKIAGRDAGNYCVILEEQKDGLVLVDGETRRRSVNVKHLEPTNKVLKINKGGSRSDVVALFKSELNIELKDSKPKKAAAKPVKQKVKKEKVSKQAKSTKSAKKVSKKEETVKKTPESAKKVENESDVESEVKNELSGNKK